jgi:hypothetical protein
MAEVQMYKTDDEGEMILMRFLYKEQKIKNSTRPNPLIFPGPCVIMPKHVAKDFLKKFLGFIAKHDEFHLGGKNEKKERPTGQ